MSDCYSIGVMVQTHSLSVIEYNGLKGTVTGAVTVGINNVTRVPVSLQLIDGSKKIISLQPHNLMIIAAAASVTASSPSSDIKFQRQFMIAIREGNIRAIKKYVKGGFDLNVTFGHMVCTPMCMAAYDGRVDMITLLAELGGDLNMPSIAGFTPVFIAAQQGHVDVVRLVAELGADINTISIDGCTPVYMAAQKGHEDVIRVLAEFGVDLNCPQEDGCTPVYIASRNNHVQIVRTLAELGADINTSTNNGCTPMSVAAQDGHVDVIKTLAEFGGDVNTPDDDGSTPVYAAAQYGHVGVVKVLAKLGANVNTPKNSGGTPVLVAALEGQTAVIKALYKLGADMKPDFEFSVAKLAQDENRTEALQLIEKIMNKLTKECDFCGSSSKRLKLCSKCEKVRYCSRECQVQDYKKHKKECISA
jgi:hypothetical protein